MMAEVQETHENDDGDDYETSGAATTTSNAHKRGSLLHTVLSHTPLRRISEKGATRFQQIDNYQRARMATRKMDNSVPKPSRSLMHEVMKSDKKYSVAELREDNHLIVQNISRKHTQRPSQFTRKPSKVKLNNPFHPNSTFRASWDVALIVLLFYTAIAVPAQIAFVVEESVSDPMFAWDCLVDVLFFLDLSFNFFTPYVDKTTNQVIEHPALIFQHYLYGWFALDFISVFPYNLIAVSLSVKGNAVSALKLIRVFRILKLARVFRASRILARWNAVLGLPIALSQLGKYALIMVVLAHWMACVWVTVPQFEDQEASWQLSYNSSYVGDNPASQYIAALYWSVMTIGTIGYGDVPVATFVEKGVAIVCMTIGCGAYSFIVGSVCGLVSSLDESTTEFNQQMDHLNVYMDKESIPRTMTVRLREYFLHSRDLLLHKHFSRVLGHLSPGLRGELCVYTAGEWIQKVHFMVGGPRGEHVRFITAICTRMDAELYPPQELIVRSGETTNKMYIISKGLVARMGRILHKGNFFGEDVILHRVEPTTVFDTRTLTYCDTYTVSREDIRAILSTGSFPAKAKLIRRAAMFMAITRRVRVFFPCSMNES
ncbi:hypothetical protein, variant [Aphanomyces invadans]|uniref:Cyclic nucleotide-binding domain-containing protein n=1 Tax=Aphanomyces invadans TaxID=157072 RepID=A0A024UEA8_9STRA|nr:hypothetical protein, variant [Aphanomyces invadans]ETW04227.1 hypothetical protein, variant [Aphanomyces invadans]|eukprot:XP_008867183.1 hypothetical protein, variant [Aphanomyces invadans]